MPARGGDGVERVGALGRPGGVGGEAVVDVEDRVAQLGVALAHRGHELLVPAGPPAAVDQEDAGPRQTVGLVPDVHLLAGVRAVRDGFESVPWTSGSGATTGGGVGVGGDVGSPLAGFFAVEVPLVCEGVEDACAAGDACTVADPITNVARASALTVTAVRTGSSFPEPIRPHCGGNRHGCASRRTTSMNGGMMPEWAMLCQWLGGCFRQLVRQPVRSLRGALRRPGGAGPRAA